MTLFDTPKVQGLPHVLKLKDKITEGIGEGWTQLFSEADDILYNICSDLYDKAVQSGEKIYPASTNVMRCFRECKLSQLKVIMIGQDPYHQPGVADGLAFSCGNTRKEQPSLKFIFDEIQKTAYHYRWVRDPDLKHWANQGVLLMNSALTVKEQTPDSHTALWIPFITHLLMKLNETQRDLIYVFLGNRAKSFSNLINNETNTKIQVVHPAAAAHRGGVWDSDGLFSKINNTLKQYEKEIIQW